jgi:hypothetical protein
MSEPRLVAGLSIIMIACVCGCGGAGAVGRAVSGAGRAIKPAGAVKVMPTRPIVPVAPVPPAPAVVPRPVIAPHFAAESLSKAKLVTPGAVADDAAKGAPRAEATEASPGAGAELLQRGLDFIPGPNNDDDRRKR